MHYLDEGPANAHNTFLCLHGEPTWCYLYRKMLRVFVSTGARVVVPDLFGFGRSDKPDDAVYSFDFHRQSLLDFIAKLALKNITVVGQDWGGILGLTLPVEVPERVGRIIAMNTILTTGELPLPDAFFAWKQWAADHPDMDIAEAMGVIDSTVPANVREVYRAPYPNLRSKAGPRAFPRLVPLGLDDPGAATSRRARDWLQNEWRGKAFIASGTQDPILSLPVMQLLASWIRGASPVHEVTSAGHYVQEQGEGVARAALAYFA